MSLKSVSSSYELCVGTKEETHALYLRWPFKPNHRSIGSVVAAAEVVTIVATSLLTGRAYHLLTERGSGSSSEFIAVGLLVSALYCVILIALKSYDTTQLLQKKLPPFKLFLAWSGIFSFLAFLAFTAKIGSHFSRGAELSFYVLGFGSLVAVRSIMTRVIRIAVAAGALTGPRIAVIFEGQIKGHDRLLNALRQYGYIIVKSASVPNRNDYGKAADEVIAYAQRNVVDEVLLFVRWVRRREIQQVLTRLRRVSAPVRLMADRSVQPYAGLPIRCIGPTLAVEVRSPPLTGFQQTLKRSADLVLAGVGLVLLGPVLLIIASLIRLESPGPIFFRQRRIGLNGQTFLIFKFRTMVVVEEGLSVRQATVDDPRITRTGRWLRRSSMDELPQLINVLRGEMSLVGPRPHAEVHDSAFDTALSRYGWRHNVKPGITGWAQVNGSRGETADNESIGRRVDYDLWYADNWSLGLDLRILIRTIPAVLGARNAY